jgi:predicted GIY-YIG superfamily endonuclease
MRQLLLLPDPRPLVETLGAAFFREAPEAPGVYLMRDAADAVLYVGKAKNLRHRLRSYRVANPDRLPRRHLRMLRAITRIELQTSRDEHSALVRETELLRALKPKFNRVGTWTAPPRFLLWRTRGENLEITIGEEPKTDWAAFAATARVARLLRTALVRLLWCAIYPAMGVAAMPSGWVHGRFDTLTCISVGGLAEEVVAAVQKLFGHQPAAFQAWLEIKIANPPHPFDQAFINADLEFLSHLMRD